MEAHNAKLLEVAQFMGVSPEILRSYLYEELDPIKEAIHIRPKLIQLEQTMIYDAAGVHFVLIEKRERPAPPPRTISDYVSKFLDGIYRAALDKSYSALYYVSHHDLATPDYFRAVLSKHPNAGVLLLIPQCADTLAEVCIELGMPCLIVDYIPKDNMPIHVLNIDNFGAELEMTRQLISLGHRRIAFITGFLEYASAADRFEGYKAALAEANIPYDPALVGYGNWGMPRGQEITRAFLELEHPPTAIVCSNDQTALGAYGAIKDCGLSIPRHISVVGFDDIPIASTIDPPLSTVRQSLSQMGCEAVNYLVEAMENPTDTEFYHKHPLELMLRASIGPVR